MSVGVVRTLRESTARMRQEFEGDLTRGVEGRAFARACAPTLSAVDDYLLELGGLREALSGAEGTPAEAFATELRLLEEETKVLRDRMAEALSLASGPAPPVDWQRLRQESDADFAASRFTTLETPEDMLKGLAGDD